MKNMSTARPRTFMLVLAATVLPVTPVVAQEAVAPPPVAATTPQPQAEAPVAVAAAPPAPVFAAPSEVVQPLPIRATPPPVASAKAAPHGAATAPSALHLTRAHSVAAPVAALPSVEPAVAAPAPMPSSVRVPAPADVATATHAPVAALPVDASTTSTTITSQSPWLWIIGGLVALGAIIALLFARRRQPVETAVYEEQQGVASLRPALPLGEPDAKKPIVKPVANLAKKSKTVVPVAEGERPWIGISLQATGSNARGDTDLVEYNLIVENAGDVTAHHVQVSTFLIDGHATSSETETSLIDPADETRSRFIDLAPGTSVPIASTLTVPHGTDPCIMAEARYPLPGGGEGHIAARFIIEATSGDTVEARLDNVLERV